MQEMIWESIICTVTAVKGPPLVDDTKTALGILNERYARGEIGKEEFLSMKNEILSR